MIILCFENKGYFFEISDIAEFVKVERRKQRGSATLNTYDYILINIVKQLCKQQKKIDLLNKLKEFQDYIKQFNWSGCQNFWLSFFLINCRFETDKEVIECVESVEKDALRDYYCGLNFSDNINNYKLIVHTTKY